MASIGVLNGNWRGADMRRYVRDVANDNPNSPFWKQCLFDALLEIRDIPALMAIWDSPLVPEHTTYKEHALIARRLVCIPNEIKTFEQVQ